MLSIKEFKLVDVIPVSLGIRNYRGIMITAFKRNTPVPAVDVDQWTTVHDFQTRITFPIFEGENRIAEENKLLGKFTLENIEICPRGAAKIEVTFKVDSDGIINVSAVDKKTKSQNNIVINCNKGRLSNNDITRMMQEVQLH